MLQMRPSQKSKSHTTTKITGSILNLLPQSQGTQKQSKQNQKKVLKRHRTKEDKTQLKEVATLVKQRDYRNKTPKWLEWCAELNQHTNIKGRWKQFHTVMRKKKNTQERHPNPKQKAEELINKFTRRFSSNSLPPTTLATQLRLNDEWWLTIRKACQTPDDTDASFTLQKMQNVKHKGRDTDPDADYITYTMVKNLG